LSEDFEKLKAEEAEKTAKLQQILYVFHYKAKHDIEY
jgi:hypothetical protein